jgi:polysaccharide export outer membrane protein
MNPFIIWLLAEAAAVAVNPDTYVIGPEDLLSVHVWKEPELSRRVPVRPDGCISLPLINDVRAAGLTPNRLAADLAEKLRQHLTEADVSVMVEQVNSKKYYVIGEVQRPGPYLLPGPVTVLQALTAAGGFKDFAETRKIQVLRRNLRLAFDYNAVVKGKKPEQNFVVEPGDTIVVP